LTTHGGVRAGSQSVGELLADREFVRDRGCAQGLLIGVQGVELDTAESFLNHSRDCVGATAADTDYFDAGA
jgi:hypothetical protein